jgi:sec-independent protein translocase protein TatB
MFGLDWTEIALIGVVALIAIGPKDLPIAIKTLAGFLKKARRMAGDFQGHVDEMVREANLHEVRDQISQLKNFDIKGEIAKAVDSDGSIRAAMNENPLAPGYTPYTPPAEDTIVAAHTAYPADGMAESTIAEALPAPSFIPPTSDIVAPMAHVAAPAPPPPQPPAFVPPETDAVHHSA